jgi:hypothetical protein
MEEMGNKGRNIRSLLTNLPVSMPGGKAIGGVALRVCENNWPAGGGLSPFRLAISPWGLCDTGCVLKRRKCVGVKPAPRASIILSGVLVGTGSADGSPRRSQEQQLLSPSGVHPKRRQPLCNVCCIEMSPVQAGLTVLSRGTSRPGRALTANLYGCTHQHTFGT